MKSFWIGAILMAIMSTAFAEEQAPRTNFQTPHAWKAEIDLQSDAVMVYGIDASFPDKVKSWREQGYQVDVMTGSAWGGYEDYFEGRFDGVPHPDEAQMERNGQKVMHGPTVPYIVPTPSYRKYLFSLVKQTIDQHVGGIFLEEPEYWARTGYSEGFKKEWKRYYGSDWVAPHTNVDSRYKAAKLMYMLYRDTLSEIYEQSKAYSKTLGYEVRCYVPTHSLINYSMWQIVTPMCSLMAVPYVDGYIAQVWTGTARTANNYRGEARERTFETAFMEYAQMVSMVRPTGRTCYLLADPVEDNPNYGWDDYEANYKRVLVGSLMQPDEFHYEVSPWPGRVLMGDYFATNADAAKRDETNPPSRIKIPSRYATVLQSCFNALNHMEADADQITWDSGTQGIGVVVSDSLMFQRDDPTPSDRPLGSFFGLSLPILKHGMPVKVVQLETLTDVQALNGIQVLMLTYEGMKPMSPDYHDVIAEWVKQGGALILVDNGNDPYNQVREWWNQEPMDYATPYEDLIIKLGFERDLAAGMRTCGQGVFFFAKQSPAELSYAADGADKVRDWTKQVLNAMGKDDQWREQSHLILRRGNYVIAANMNESVSDVPVKVPGVLVDLFNADLPVLSNPEMGINQVGYFVDVDKIANPGVVASASRIRDEETEGNQFSFVSRGPIDIRCTTVLRLPAEPNSFHVMNGETEVSAVETSWDESTGTFKLSYDNAATPLTITVKW